MKIRKLTALAVIAAVLTACGDTAEETSAAVTESASAATAATTTATTTTAATTTAVTTTTSETTTEPTTTTTAQTTEAAPVFSEFSEPDPDKFKVYQVEPQSGYPEICDIEAIKARQKTDAESFYDTDYVLHGDEGTKHYYDEKFGPETVVPDYENGSYRYIEEDVDYDGKNEYYLIIENELDFSNADPLTLGGILTDEAGAVTVYYIEDTGEISFVHFMNNMSVGEGIHTNQKFYMVDYGDCKHLIRWYWPAYDGLGGDGFETLFDRNRFIELPDGGVYVDGSNENKALVAYMYTWIDEYVWDGSDYTAYYYEDSRRDENGEWIVPDDYHDLPREEETPEKLKWYYGE